MDISEIKIYDNVRIANYFMITSIQVDTDNIIVYVNLENRYIKDDVQRNDFIKSLQIQVGKEVYSTFTPSDLYTYIGDYLVANY